MSSGRLRSCWPRCRICWASTFSGLGRTKCGPIEFDLFGQTGYEHEVDFVYPSDEVRIDGILGLIKAGVADRILLSHDVAFKTSMQTHGGHGYSYVPRVIVPWLKRRGADHAVIEQIMIPNAPFDTAATHKSRQDAGDGALSETERAELARLRKENSELKVGSGVLEKASLFFAQEASDTNEKRSR